MSPDQRYIVEDDDGNPVVKQPTCPRCGQLPVRVFGLDSQAFCGNNDCAQFTWNPRMTALELIENAQEMVITSEPDSGHE